jgi:hypothetical protein
MCPEFYFIPCELNFQDFHFSLVVSNSFKFISSSSLCLLCIFSFLLLCISSTTSACFEDEDERGTRNEREMESQLQLWLKDIFVLFGRRFYVMPKQHNSQYKMNKIRCSRIDKIMKMYECEIFLMQKENSTEKKTIYSNANRT